MSFGTNHNKPPPPLVVQLQMSFNSYQDWTFLSLNTTVLCLAYAMHFVYFDFIDGVIFLTLHWCVVANTFDSEYDCVTNFLKELNIFCDFMLLSLGVTYQNSAFGCKKRNYAKYKSIHTLQNILSYK